MTAPQEAEFTLDAIAAYRLLADYYGQGEEVSLSHLVSMISELPDGETRIVIGLGNVITHLLSLLEKYTEKDSNFWLTYVGISAAMRGES